MTWIEVRLNGQMMRFACAPGEEDHLRTLINDFDARLNHLRDEYGQVGDVRLLTMTGLTFVDALAEAEAKIEAQSAEIHDIKVARSVADMTDAQIAETIEALSRRLENLVDKLSRRFIDQDSNDFPLSTGK